MESAVKYLARALLIAIIIAIVLTIIMMIVFRDKWVLLSSAGKDTMSVGAHWIQQGEYGHTGSTLPTYDLSGYYQSVPTPPDA